MAYPPTGWFIFYKEYMWRDYESGEWDYNRRKTFTIFTDQENHNEVM